MFLFSSSFLAFQFLPILLDFLCRCRSRALKGKQTTNSTRRSSSAHSPWDQQLPPIAISNQLPAHRFPALWDRFRRIPGRQLRSGPSPSRIPGSIATPAYQFTPRNSRLRFLKPFWSNFAHCTPSRHSSLRSCLRCSVARRGKEFEMLCARSYSSFEGLKGSRPLSLARNC